MDQPTLETEWLLLRPFVLADAPEVQRLAGAREVAETTLHIPHPYPEGAAATWIGKHRGAWEAGAVATFAIVERSSDQLVGAIGLVMAAEHARGEIGYWIAVDRWGRGYATEAARAIVEFAFETLRLNRIQARHLTRNPASGRVMQKLGMRLEGVNREAVRKWDRFEDLAVYGLLARDWNGSAPRSMPN